MPVYLVAFTMHADPDTPAERQRAELRSGGLRALISDRFSQRRLLSERAYVVETVAHENMATVWAFAEPSDEVYVIPLSGPVEGTPPPNIDTLDWLRTRLG